MIRLIDANALIDAMYNARVASAYEAQDIINSAPTIEPKRGEWLWDDGHFCSECHKWAIYDASLEERLFDFCPNCGADMRGEREGE